MGATLELTAIGAACGLLVGAVAGVFLVRRHGTEGRKVRAVVTVVGALCGALGGGLSVPMTTIFGGRNLSSATTATKARAISTLAIA